MPNIYRFSLDLLDKEIERVTSLGIPAIALFPKDKKRFKKPLMAKNLIMIRT